MNACPQAILCSAPTSETHSHLSCVMEGLMEAVNSAKLSYHSEDSERGGEGRDGPITQDYTSAALVCAVRCVHDSYVWSALGALHSKLRLTVQAATEGWQYCCKHTHTPDYTLSITNIKTRTFLLSSFFNYSLQKHFLPPSIWLCFLFVCMPQTLAPPPLLYPNELVPEPAGVHALNILRALVRDAQLADSIAPFLGRVYILSVNGFSSEHWAVSGCAV